MNAKALSEAERICTRIMDASSVADLIINKLDWGDENPDTLRNAVDWINGCIIDDACKLNDLLTGPEGRVA